MALLPRRIAVSQQAQLRPRAPGLIERSYIWGDTRYKAAMNPEASARSLLRAATRGQHDQVDRLYSQVRFDDRRAYGAFLSAQAAAHIPVESALAAGCVGAIVPDWEARQRGALVAADLAALGLAVPDPAGTIAFEGESAVLGGLYVLEGSRLGGTMLQRSVPADFPTRFLGGVDSAAWRSLLQLLDLRLDSELKRAVAVAAARNVFALFETSGRRFVRTGDFG